MKRIIILGATGSIGKTALHIAREFPHLLEIVGLHAHTQVEHLLRLKQEFPLAVLAVTGLHTSNNKDIIIGKNALETLIMHTQADLVLNGIAGAVGLHASIYTLKSGKILALANKESMVMAGSYLHALSQQYQATILPVDSEHSALFYLMECQKEITEYIITASGGSFRGKTREQLVQVTAKEAMNHPTWSMGAKISIDSATLANKGLEILEAWKLLNIPIHKISVLEHPQSLVHALVRGVDGALQAYISSTNMQLPIQNALLYPIKEIAKLSFLDLSGKNLSFNNIDHKTFPMINFAYQAAYQGDPYPIVYNAVNEEAVSFFMNNHISFLDISDMMDFALKNEYPYIFDPLNTQNIWQADAWSRNLAHTYYRRYLV